MAIKGNNSNQQYSFVRDSFFSESEKKFFTKLLEDPTEMKIHSKLLTQKVELLYKKAVKLISRVEAGEFNEKQMANVEYMIAHYLAAIEDFERVLELELTI